MQELPEWDDESLNQKELANKYHPELGRTFEETLEDIRNLKGKSGFPSEGPPVIQGSSSPGGKGYFNPKIFDPWLMIQHKNDPYKFTEQISPLEFTKLADLTNFMDNVLHFPEMHPKFQDLDKFRRFHEQGASVEFWIGHFSTVLRCKIYSHEMIVVETDEGEEIPFVALIVAESKETQHIHVLLKPTEDHRTNGAVAHKLFCYHILDFLKPGEEMGFESMDALR